MKQIYNHYCKFIITFIHILALSACGSGSNTDTTLSEITPDTTKPTITLNGANSIAVNKGEPYVELGASAIDDRDGELSVYTTTTGGRGIGFIDTRIIGEYLITYSALDSAGNTVKTTRTVSIVMPSSITISPITITIIGEPVITLKQHDPYVEAGATAVDDQGNTLPVSITGSVDTSTQGDFIVTYTAEKPSFTPVHITRTISITPSPENFVGIWHTTLNRSPTIATGRLGSNYDIHWGSGVVTRNVVDRDLSSPFNEYGEQTIWISGDYPRLYFGWYLFGCGLTSVEQWGTQQWKSMASTFWDCNQLSTLPAEAPDLSIATSMESMFREASIFNQDISHWDVSSVTNMSYLFSGASAFDQDLSLWDVSAVIEMNEMFTSSGLSTVNYDAILIGWSSQPLQNDVTFDVGTATYSSVAESARDILINTYGWTINDGGIAL